MVTESEQKWLRGRELSPRPYCASCINAKICAKTRKQCWCPTDARSAHTLSDALEFSERVGARLARMMLRPNEYKYPCRDGVPELGCMRDMTALTGPYAVHCEDCIMREVRLQVEEGMNAKV